jgi:hypothetical protein
MTFYHRTTVSNAAAILQNGFADGIYHLYDEEKLRGVFVSDVPLDNQEGAGPAGHAVVLAIELKSTINELVDFEVVEEGKPYREWCIPAGMINSEAAVSIVPEENLGDLENRF